jgi:integrase
MLVAHRFPGEARITKSAVARIYARMQEPRAERGTGLAVKNIHEMLRGAWRYGIQHKGWIDRNIWELAERPTEGKKLKAERDKLWLAEHYGPFFEWCIAKDHRLWRAWMFSATSSDRRGGNLGLRWDAVDLDDGSAWLTFFVEEDIGHRIIVKEYGKETGGHQIPLDSPTRAALRLQRSRQAQERLAAGNAHVCPSTDPYCPLPGYHDRGLVFCARNGEYLHPSRFTREFQREIARYNRAHPEASLPMIDIHTLRHGWSTIAENLGVSETLRMDRLDQSTPAVNQIYTHAIDSARREAAEMVAATMLPGLRIGA